MTSRRTQPTAERGESLVEVLIAMAILLVILVGVLQLFTMALLTFHSNTAQREMTRKAETVVEVIRLINATQATGAHGILPMAVDTRSLPVNSSYTGWDFWGPDGFAVVEENARYRISYQITDGGADWVVSVFVEPNSSGSGGSYLGSVGGKAVRYAARIPQ